MKVVDPGHSYELKNLDDPDGEVPPALVYFVKRDGEGYPGNVGHHAGTNMQDVMRMLIDRLHYLDKQEHDHRNGQIIRVLRDSIWDLESRAAERHGRQLSMRDIDEAYEPNIEDHPVCSKCGHIGCKETCTK